jgi:peptidoglycan/LPS O-acetylase OafA/YrhL
MPKRLKFVLIVIAVLALPNAWHVFHPVSPATRAVPIYLIRLAITATILVLLYHRSRAGWKFARVWFGLGIVLSIGAIAACFLPSANATPRNVAWTLLALVESILLFALLGHRSVRTHFGTLKQLKRHNQKVDHISKGSKMSLLER